jgi:hypothetical protein
MKGGQKTPIKFPQKKIFKSTTDVAAVRLHTQKHTHTHTNQDAVYQCYRNPPPGSSAVQTDTDEYRTLSWNCRVAFSFYSKI